MNYWPRWINAIRKRTASLSLVQMGAYDRLLDHYYAEEQPLPGTLDECCRICSAIDKVEREAVRYVLERYFTLADGKFVQERADEEIALAKPKIEAARLNGKTGGRPRKNPTGTHEKPTGFPAGTHEEPRPKAPQQHTSTPSGIEEIPPIAPQGGTSTRKSKPRKPESDREPLCTLATWIAAERAAGRDAIPADDPVFAYAAEVRIPREFLALAWREFRHRYTEAEKAKRYRDWRAVFRKAVRGNWLRLWWLDPGSQQYALTTVGQQAQRAASAASRPQPPQPDKDAA